MCATWGCESQNLQLGTLVVTLASLTGVLSVLQKGDIDAFNAAVLEHQQTKDHVTPTDNQPETKASSLSTDLVVNVDCSASTLATDNSLSQLDDEVDLLLSL